MNLLKHLRSNQFAILIAILSVLVQSFHSFTAFYNTSSLQNGWGIAQAIVFAAIIDLAILFYTVRGRRDISMYAAVAMVVINVYYYYQHLGVTFEFMFGCFLSLIIPISVYFYSEEIKDESPDYFQGRITELLSIITAGKKENDDLIAKVDTAKQIATNWSKEATIWENRYNEVFKDWKAALDGNKELSSKLDLEINNNAALKNDLDYVRKQMNTSHVDEELDPDNIEFPDKTPISITRTGGTKL